MALTNTTKKVIIEVTLDDNASVGLKQIGSATEKTSEKISSSFVKMATISAAAITTIRTAYKTIAQGINVAGQLETATQGFKALLGSAEKAGKTMERIKKEAKATPFEITGLVTGAQALTAITKDGDKAIDTLLNVGKAVAISGRGQEELDRVVYNLQQISATGVVTAMDIRQFQSAIPVFNDVLELSGLTVQELQNSANSAELLFAAFDKYGTEGAGAKAFSEQAGTWAQLLSNAKDAWNIFTADLVTKTGLFDIAKDAIKTLTDNVEVWAEKLGNAATVMREETADEVSGLAYVISGDKEFGLEASVDRVRIAWGELMKATTGESLSPMETLFTMLTGWSVMLSKVADGISNIIFAVSGLITKIKELNKENPWNNPVSGIKSLFEKKASGGITRGGMTLVGEAGPELVSLPRGSHVYNNQDTRQMASSGSITINVNAPVTGVDNLKAVILEAVNEATAQQNRLANYNLL